MGDVRGFWAAAEAEPARLAVVDPSGRQWTAGEVLAGANQVVHGLRARGVGKGSRIATVLPNGIELIEVVLAAFQAGWHYTAINTNLSTEEIAHILRDSGAAAVVAHASYGDRVRAAAEDAGVPAAGRVSVGEIDGFVPLHAVKDSMPTSMPPDRVGGQFMQYTSGTTGRPKAVVRDLPDFDPETQAKLYSANLERFDITPGGDDVHLVTSPMYHMAPLSYGLFSLHYEHTVVLMDRFDAEAALALIEKHRVTTTHMVPTQFHRLARLDPSVREKYDVSSLRNVLHAAAPCPVPLKREMLEWFGPVIYEYYGATEGGGTLAKPDEWLAHPGTVGRPWPGADVKILDDDGNELGPGQLGTVYMKVVADFAYKDDDEKTRSNRVNGYFTVGDVGEVDEDGFLYLRDRKIDMIISGGVNIYPAEIEGALLSHPAVGDVAVFGIPNDEWGEEVKAVVEVAAGREASPELAAELSAHCAAHLAGYKVPRTIDFIDAMPRDPNGKLFKRRLRDPYWQDRERAI